MADVDDIVVVFLGIITERGVSGSLISTSTHSRCLLLPFWYTHIEDSDPSLTGIPTFEK